MKDIDAAPVWMQLDEERKTCSNKLRTESHRLLSLVMALAADFGPSLPARGDRAEPSAACVSIPPPPPPPSLSRLLTRDFPGYLPSLYKLISLPVHCYHSPRSTYTTSRSESPQKTMSVFCGASISSIGPFCVHYSYSSIIIL